MTASPWFRPTTMPPRTLRLVSAHPTTSVVHSPPPPPPGPPTVDAIMTLVRTYGHCLIDETTAKLGLRDEPGADSAGAHAERLYELIEHNVATLAGYLDGYRTITSNLQKGITP